MSNVRPSAKRLFVYCLVPALMLSLSSLGIAWANRDSAAIVPPTKQAAKQSKSAQAGFKNWGLINNVSNSHIQAPEAWKISEGNKDILVAVIDTGIDASHRDLKQNVWQSPKEKTPLRAINEYGWDFVRNKSNPIDDHGHGTHVAGIIGAAANVDAGVSGVAPKVSIMAVKYYSDANPGPVNLRNTIKAISYAVERGARIINYSGGGPEFSQEEYMAIKKAESKGVLFVSAAGNERQNTDLTENFYYPSAYGLPNIISVAAIDINNNLLPSSNWGATKVDVAAPGENIFSTLPGNNYGYMSGTSQATAFVSGLAALLLAENPKLSASELKALIRETVDAVPQLKGKISTGGKINAYAALNMLKELKKKKNPPAAGSLLADAPGLWLRLPSSGAPNSNATKTR